MIANESRASRGEVDVNSLIFASRRSVPAPEQAETRIVIITAERSLIFADRKARYTKSWTQTNVSTIGSKSMKNIGFSMREDGFNSSYNKNTGRFHPTKLQIIFDFLVIPASSRLFPCSPTLKKEVFSK